MFVPVLLFSFAGIVVALGSLFNNATIFGSLANPTTGWYKVWDTISAGGWTVFNQECLLFVVGLPIGLANKSRGRAAMEALITYLTFNYFVGAMLSHWGAFFGVPNFNKIQITANATNGGLTEIAGIKTLDTNIVFSLIIAGIVVYLHNHYFDKKLPEWLGTFQGSTYVYFLGFFVMIPVAFLTCLIWPKVQLGINSMQHFIVSSGFVGIWIYSFLNRVLIPTGLHHLVYIPFQFGPAVVAGGLQPYWLKHLTEYAASTKPLSQIASVEGFQLYGNEKVFLVPFICWAFYATAKKNKKKQIAILGSTGSIGTQALQVIEEHPDLYEPYALTANNRVDLLVAQARKFQPEVVVIANEAKYAELKEALSDLPIKVYAGTDAICQIVEAGPIDMVLTAMVGYAGLKPTMNAIRARKAIALANKETLVVAGELINQLAQQYRTPILPVDSEHSAVFQCLAGEVGNPIEKVILTASGGPFRTYTLEQLKTVTKTQALKHPNWEMGAKITIDSASMMNKGFEVIEAKWLFGVQPGQIEVVVHPQSVIHSMVQFEDGAVKAQLGMPDMRLPIQYAFSYPDRICSSFDRLDFTQCTNLTFEQPDTKRFRNLALAYEAMYRGGNMPCIVNAANEVVVASFLKDGISFLGMSDVIEKTMEQAAFVANPSYEDYVATDEEARRIASELVRRQNPQK